MQSNTPKRVFVKLSISSRLKCPICYDVFTKPRRLFCGHTFCKGCLIQMLKPHKNPQHVASCPMCRVPIDTDNIGKDLIAIKIIDELVVMCPVNGCPWRGENQLLQTHYGYQCRMKQIFKNYQPNNTISVDTREEEHQDQVVAERVNENVQRGSLISRVISKNPQLMSFRTIEEVEDQPICGEIVYSRCVKKVVTRSTQTERKVKVSKDHDKHQQRRSRISQKRFFLPASTPVPLRSSFVQVQTPVTLDKLLSQRKTKSQAIMGGPVDNFDSKTIYEREQPKIDIINLQQNKKRIHIRRSRPRPFRE